MKKHLEAHFLLWENLTDIVRLLEIHARTAGTGPGRKYNVEVLNRSAIVLLVACWESFVEDLAAVSFQLLIDHADKPSVFPQKVLTLAAKDLRSDQDARKVWALAGDGWRSVLKKHKEAIFDRYIGRMNTPRPGQVDNLYQNLMGVPAVSKAWSWGRTSARRATQKLDELVNLRGAIAHRVSAGRPVHKQTVIEYTDFVNRIAVKTSNHIRDFIFARISEAPWGVFAYRSPFKAVQKEGPADKK